MSIVDQAMDNLTLNVSGLLDKYKLEEQLRANQAENALGILSDRNELKRKIAVDKNKLERSTIGSQQQLDKWRTTGADYRYEMQRKNLATQAALNAKKTGAAVKQYMSQVKDKRMQSDAVVRGVENNMANLLAEQVNDMSIKQLERNIRVVASMMDQGAAKAAAGQRGGGSSTSRRLAMNEAQKLGRQYGEIQTLRQRQGSQLSQMNADMAGPQATKLARLAESMQNDVTQSRSLIKQTKSTNKMLKRQQESIFSQRKEGIRAFSQNSRLRQFQLRKSNDDLKAAAKNNMIEYRKAKQDFKITKQGFRIASRQGQRELTGLYLQTDAMLDQASMPYRDAIIFDPLEPIEGLPPEKRIPSFSQPQSPINSYANAIMGGVQTAMNFSTMTSDGLKFY